MKGKRVGQEIAGKYRLTRLLGEGGMGSVYEAQHTLIGRRFAIKFLHQKLAESPEMLARFRREAQAAGALESENIAAVTDFGTAEDGAPFIVLEFLTGEDLGKVLAKGGPMVVPRLVEIVTQACRGLGPAHAAGIVHRDLKPENLFIARRGDGTDLVKVLDFGIAKLRTAEGDGSSTRTGTTMGTPFYMPPEQARGDKDIDHRADIYALGVILYEGLSGKKPHPGDSYNAILYHILSKPTVPLDVARPGLPSGLSNVVHRALSFEAADRHASVAELIEALAPFSTRPSVRIEASSPGTAPASGTAITVETPPSLVRTAAPPTEKSAGSTEGTLSVPVERTRWRLAAALAALGVFIGGFVLSGGTSRETPPAGVSGAPVLAPSVAALAPSGPTPPVAPVAPASTALVPAPSASAAAPKEPAAARTLPPEPAPSRPVVARPTGSPPQKTAEPATVAAPTATHPSVASFGTPTAPAPAPAGAKRGARPLSFDKSNPY